MILQTLPPAGNPIVTKLSSAASENQLNWPGYNLQWLQSGTAALAFSLQHKKAAFKHITQPEVIVPAYCCPDLLSAAQFAGYVPVVVDINPNDPSYNLEALAKAVNANTLAVIVINFMGIKERLAQLKEVVAPFSQVSIIEDNAQWFPVTSSEAQFEGDYVCFSFGRGKAVSLLGGGLVALKESLPQHTVVVNKAQVNTKKWLLKAHIINRLSNTFVYNLLTKLSFLNIGATRFHELSELSGFPFESLQALNANLHAYQQRASVAEPILDDALAQLNVLQPINSQRRGRLLRYPVLCESTEQRNALYEALISYGASKMYTTSLPQVQGVQPAMWHGDGHYEHARHFAQCFLTLPVHAGVTEKHARAMAKIIAQHS
ncbi:DegT/DnrJ/EryC1/StrS family aminotransferase [Reinekea forsetii]|nr:DegT/DnrJ/EryC1/StrS family aminotransferase [Reinekea forsetii]